MAENGGEWVLVGAKRRTHRASTSKHTAVAGPQGTKAHRRTAAAAAAIVEREPFDRNARVPEAKHRAIQARVERIAAALLTQAEQSNATLIGTALQAVSDHFRWSDVVDDPAQKRRLHVVSYGLGSFCSSSNAVHQLAFVHALVRAATARHENLETTLEIFDPVMNASDREIAAGVGITTIDENESGKRVASAPTVFFMPHCGHALNQNVVAANFVASTLHHALIIGNSFEAYGDRLIDAAARKASILLGVLPFVAESALPIGLASAHDDFSLYESAFNDLSIHTFTREQANAAYVCESLQTLIAELHTAEQAASSVLATAIDRELIA